MLWHWVALPCVVLFRTVVLLSGNRAQLSPASVRIVSRVTAHMSCSLFELRRSIITDPQTLHLQPALLNLTSELDNFLVRFGSQIRQNWTIKQLIWLEFWSFNKWATIWENSAASSKCADWVSLTPYLINQNHVSKHIQLHNVLTQHDFATP